MENNTQTPRPNPLLSAKAKELKNAYQREWRRKNPDKTREYIRRHWEKQADPTGAKVRQLNASGLSQRAIAETLNISLGTVNAILNT
jgi:DNA-binding NarL/FixJ family response regulator